MRIDGHQHFWSANRGDYHWMNESVAVLCRDYLPEDLLPVLKSHGIEKTILVQAAQTTAETDFLLDLAAEHDFIAGVVGWLDMDRHDFSRQFERYRGNPRFIGLRPMLQDLEDQAWILRPRVLESLKLVAEADFPFEFLTYTRHLVYVLRALDAVGPMRAVIDHLSKPPINARTLEPWKTLMAQVAAHPHVFCKLSGMITEADHQHWTSDDLRPYVEHVIDCFGPDRLIFGSDWPVCLLAGSYEQVLETTSLLTKHTLDEHSRDKLFGVNAIRFYKLSPNVRP